MSERVKKPEKKEYNLALNTGWGDSGDAYCGGYNQACEDWDKWLPSEDELKTIVTEALPQLTIWGKNTLASAIHARLEGR